MMIKFLYRLGTGTKNSKKNCGDGTKIPKNILNNLVDEMLAGRKDSCSGGDAVRRTLSSNIDDYDIGQVLGRGGFASVYRAR